MLVLTRRINEEIVVDDVNGQIRLRVLSVKGARVKLGIVAPGDISIVRPADVFDQNPASSSE